MDLENIYSVNARMQQWFKMKIKNRQKYRQEHHQKKYKNNRNKYSLKQADSVINVVQLNTHINNVHSKSTNSPYVSIVGRKAISLVNALKMRKDYIVKEDHVLDVDRFGILLRTAQPDMEIIANLTINSSFDFYFLNMCQCLLCDCWWWGCCDIACLGVGGQTFCCGFWCCKHDQVQAFDPICCTCCQQTGFGGECCCVGSVCCAPEWLRKFSEKKKSAKKKHYEE